MSRDQVIDVERYYDVWYLVRDGEQLAGPYDSKSEALADKAAAAA